MADPKQSGPGKPPKQDAHHIHEVRQRRAKAPPGTSVWSLALQLGRELAERGEIEVKPESFARRISDKLKRAEGSVAVSPYRATFALNNLRTHLIAAWYWYEEYRKTTRRGASPALPNAPELSPWTRDLMELLAIALSPPESED